MNISEYLATTGAAVEDALRALLPPVTEPPARLHEAMAYSVLSGGKHVRPVLVIAAAEACGATADRVMPTACALECIHAYSLIHDDLPCMDDDDLRRGKPTNHKGFGEALAVLAGDALQAHAFRLIADNARVPGISPESVVRVTALVAEAASSLGMVGGQAADCLAEGRKVTESEVEFIHARKTGALIRASVMAGAELAGAPEALKAALSSYGGTLGLLFQVTDDILNVEGDPAKMGKAAGSDEELEKASYPRVAGVELARERARALAGEAEKALAPLGKRGETLVALARFVLERRA